jgi:hypothetical protein
MGYCTDFTLEVVNGPSIIESPSSEFRDRFYNLTGYNVHNLDYIKWYSAESDMKKLSLHYPDVVFCLEGQGENHDDFWVIYICNGHIQNANRRIVEDPIDFSQLDNYDKKYPEYLL